mmetsp:Transcript_117111/g.311432  ORF Transcript_117111/g.311432 Transcript_117111/m.311432 type:complete len:346 (+) Transcript_117111:26-1063(+)
MEHATPPSGGLLGSIQMQEHTLTSGVFRLVAGAQRGHGRPRLVLPGACQHPRTDQRRDVRQQKGRPDLEAPRLPVAQSRRLRAAGRGGLRQQRLLQALVPHPVEVALVLEGAQQRMTAPRWARSVSPGGAALPVHQRQPLQLAPLRHQVAGHPGHPLGVPAARRARAHLRADEPPRLGEALARRVPRPLQAAESGPHLELYPGRILQLERVERGVRLLCWPRREMICFSLVAPRLAPPGAGLEDRGAGQAEAANAPPARAAAAPRREAHLGRARLLQRVHVRRRQTPQQVQAEVDPERVAALQQGLRGRLGRGSLHRPRHRRVPAGRRVHGGHLPEHEEQPGPVA